MAENKKYKSDIEIAREAKIQSIVEISEKKLIFQKNFLNYMVITKRNLVLIISIP